MLSIPVYIPAGDLRKCTGKMHFDLIRAVCYASYCSGLKLLAKSRRNGVIISMNGPE